MHCDTDIDNYNNNNDTDIDNNDNNYDTNIDHYNTFLKEIFLSPWHDQVVMIKSRNFFYCESFVFSGFILIYQGL